MTTYACLLCDKNILEDQRSKTFKAGGINTLIQSSLLRKDGKHQKMKGLTSIVVHDSCYVMYNRETSISNASYKSTSTSISRRSSHQKGFDFSQFCFFCGEDASEKFIQQQKKKAMKYRKSVTYVTKPNFRCSLINTAQTRNDAFSNELQARLIGVDNLVELRARYHTNCYYEFIKFSTHDRSSGRPVDRQQYKAVQFVIDYLIDHKDECQFLLSEILNDYEDEVPKKAYILKHLQEYFEDDILIHNSRKDTIISFRDVGGKILNDNWYSTRLADEDEERQRIVKAAALIILNDIRSQIYETTHYPAPNYFLDDIEKDIPTTLQLFLDIIIKKNKVDNEKWNNRVNFFSHAIISTARPRSFISPLLLGLSSMLHKKYASKDLIDSLSYLGLCASYNETLLFEASILNDPQVYKYKNSYVQFVFDSANNNTNTIDGLNTFFPMGGIMCVTPGSSLTSSNTIKRLQKIPSANYVGRFGFLKVQTFDRGSSVGLKNILIEDLNLKNNIASKIKMTPTDFIWCYGKKENSSIIPNWNRFMEQVTTNFSNFATSKVVPLRFVNNPSSQYDTIFTVLLEADRECKSKKQKNCFVTFDQPLYLKAREILTCGNFNDDDYNLSSVIVRLGGFHTVMSYISSIGYIMEGSGLAELFSEIYTEASVPKMLSGHAYSKDFRGHFMVQSALIEIILSSMDFSSEETSCLSTLLSEYYDNSTNFMSKITDDLKNIVEKFACHLDILKNNGPTAQLWIQYIDLITILKQFVEAERSGNWKLHLNSLQRMLPIFHASGHFLCAKSAHLYLQEMLNLETIMDIHEYQKFTELGFFTIRRSEKYWSGIWSDMTIEQVLMRSMKIVGGQTHGRGITQSVLAKWTLSMLVLVEVSEAMESFCKIHSNTSEQHVDVRSSRISRDNQDRIKLMQYLEMHTPFPQTNFLMSISTGMKGTEIINCHEAFSVGTSALTSMTGKTFDDVKFETKNRVLPIRAVNSWIKIGNDIISIDPTLLFQRISRHIEKKENMEEFLKYELAPFPPSLFNEGGMRKTQKAVFYENFLPLEESARLSLGKVVYVIDGEFLLHRVVWRQNQSVNTILNQYITYVKKYYRDSVIVFDGYPDISTNLHTKSAERARIACQVGKEIAFERTTCITTSQETFLSNEKNITRLVTMLREDFTAEGYRTLQAEEDADTLIVETALEISNKVTNSVIVGEDIDLLVILTQLVPNNRTIYFLKPGKGQVNEKLYSNNCFKYSKLKDLVAFLHVFTGCDTTSAFYRLGKNKLIKLFDKNDDLIKIATTFYDFNADHLSIAKAGNTIIKRLYFNKNENISLNALRYLLFKKSSIKSSFKLGSLPPTGGASAVHSYRTHLQIQQWLGNSKDLSKWGWKATTGGLIPVYTTANLIPANLLEFISCKCEAGCKSMLCNCKRHGLRCSDICYNCHGRSCSNIEEVTVEIEDEHVNNDISEENNKNEDTHHSKRQRLH